MNDRKTYQQVGAIIGAGAFVVLTLLIWAIAGIGLVNWLIADVVCAAMGAIAGGMIFEAHKR